VLHDQIGEVAAKDLGHSGHEEQAGGCEHSRVIAEGMVTSDRQHWCGG
jgi:hypothetical protein